MELDAMATELWLLLSCEWTEAVEEGGEHQPAPLLKSSYYNSQSVFLSVLCFSSFYLFNPATASAVLQSAYRFCFFLSAL